MTTDNFTTKALKYLELIFPANVSPLDLKILRAPSGTRPGLACLKQALKEDTATPGAWRLLSVNSGLLLGIMWDTSHLAVLLDGPADNCYWLLDEGPGDE